MRSDPALSAREPWPAPPARGPLDATVALPGSKSLTARALVLAAVAEAPTTLTGVLRSRDTDLMLTALTALGARFEEIDGDPTRLRARPVPLPAHVETGPDGAGRIDVGLAGTVMRFVPPLAAIADAPVVFDGDRAARLRPLSPLLDALAELGAEVTCLGEPGRLPVRVGPGDGALRRPVDPAHPERPHRVSVDASASSQFLSALLLVGPLLPGGLAVTAVGHITSLPHVTMTVAGLRERGIVVEGPEEPEEPEGPGEPGEPGGSAGPADPSADTSGSGRTWIVHPGRPAGGRAGIEPDLSNAGPFLAAALIAGGEVRLPGWPAPTTQAGDAWRELLPRLGGDVELRDGPEGVRTLVVRGAGASSLRGIDADLSAVGELTPVVAALAALASEHGHPSRLRGIAHLRGHETDRLAALVTEITRVGGIARQTDDGLMIDALPAGDRLHPALLRSYADHRIAAFAALIGLGVPGTELDDVECTSKTLPDFPALWAGLLGREPSRGLDQSGVPR